MILSLGFYSSLIDDDDGKQKFEYIYEHYRYRMFYICRDILKDYQHAEDALQEAFLYIAKRIDKIQEVESNAAAGYIFLIAKCRAIDLYRRITKDWNREFDIEDYGLIANNEVESQVIEDEQQLAIIAAIQSLKSMSREVLELYLHKEMSKKEIATLLNINYDTIRKRIKTGLRELQLELNKRGIYE